MGREVLEQCFDLLFYCIADNPENQIYVADHMPVLLAHLSTQKMAAECVTEMLSKNVELQETKIGTREIQIFVHDEPEFLESLHSDLIVDQLICHLT
jgi:hypothetical protein